MVVQEGEGDEGDDDEAGEEVQLLGLDGDGVAEEEVFEVEQLAAAEELVEGGGADVEVVGPEAGGEEGEQHRGSSAARICRLRLSTPAKPRAAKTTLTRAEDADAAPPAPPRAPPRRGTSAPSTTAPRPRSAP